MTDEITGLIEELCIFPEYEFMSPILDEIPNPLDGGSYMPDIITFKDTPAYIYRSWVSNHEVAIDTLSVLRVALVSPRHKDLKERLVGEMVVDKRMLSNSVESDQLQTRVSTPQR